MICTNYTCWVCQEISINILCIDVSNDTLRSGGQEFYLVATDKTEVRKLLAGSLQSQDEQFQP